MDRIVKLRILADSAKYDASCSSSGSVRKGRADGIGNSDGTGICHSYTPDGRCVSLLKILLTNVCIYDCQYCVNRISSDVPRARFTVDEVVDLTIEFYRRNYIEGLFLSSGIIQSADYTTEQMVEVARRLRIDHRFGGYIHLKIIPGAAAGLVAHAGLYADRVSANIELASQAELNRLAPDKSRAVIEQTMATVSEAIGLALPYSAGAPAPPLSGPGPDSRSTCDVVRAPASSCEMGSVRGSRQGARRAHAAICFETASRVRPRAKEQTIERTQSPAGTGPTATLRAPPAP